MDLKERRASSSVEVELLFLLPRDGSAWEQKHSNKEIRFIALAMSRRSGYTTKTINWMV